MRLIERFVKFASRYAVRVSHQWQRASPLRDLSLWDLSTNDEGHLSVAGVDAVDLVRIYGSPLLVVHRSRLVKDATAIKHALRHAPSGSKVLYSYKTNCVPGILRELHGEGLGLGAEVISAYELWLAEQLGVRGDDIVYNGVNKTEESLARAASLNVLAINIDHLEEIQRVLTVAKTAGRRVRVGVRLGLERYSQFGLEIESGEAMEAVRRIASHPDHLELTCVHFNVTSNAKQPMTHITRARRALDFSARVKAETGLTPEYLDIGGGFGVATSKNMTRSEYALYRTFGALPKPPDPAECRPIEEFIADIVRVIEEHCATLGLAVPKLLVEPGRFVTSRAEFLLSEILTVKEKTNGPRFAISDAGRLSLTFPFEFEFHEVFVAQRPRAALTKSYDVMGRICTSADWMIRNRLLPELAPGDLLAIMDAGAYFSSNASNFAFPRPAVVLVSDREHRLIHRRESFDHLIAMDTSGAPAEAEEPPVPLTLN